MKANSIKEVLEIIDDLVIRFEKDQNPLGYFAAIYKMTTLKVYNHAKAKKFNDNERMERMDVVFANRYFAAADAYFKGEPASDPWQVAFDAAHNKDLVVDQHFFLSANAHINYDLGIAAASISPGEEIHSFKEDFEKMNEILASLYDTVNYDIAKIWPPLYKFLKWFDKPFKFLENLYMKLERQKAWQAAVHLAHHRLHHQQVNELEDEVAEDGKKIVNTNPFLGFVLRIVARQERGTVAQRIRIFKSK